MYALNQEELEIKIFHVSQALGLHLLDVSSRKETVLGMFQLGTSIWMMCLNVSFKTYTVV